VAVVGASTGAFGAVWAQAELRKVLASLGARVLDVELPVGRAQAKFDRAQLTDEALRERVGEVVDALAAEVRVREHVEAAA
jgi:chromate reductase, NAD(P)H dehydrogenase (quinone)